MAKSENVKKLLEIARPTTIIHPYRLNDLLGLDLTIISETFQFTGSFKFRAAYNVVANVDTDEIITASSGNFGQAIAYSCKLLNKRCTIVMPHTSAQVKVDAVREFGGTVELIDVSQISRADKVDELAKKSPGAYIASAYDDPLVIEGNSSLAHELSDRNIELDKVVAPVGGGGLISGLVQGFCEAGKTVETVGAEPLLANDAAESLRTGSIVSNPIEPQTIADGARTVSVGRHNWAIIQPGLRSIIEVPEDKIEQAVRLYYGLVNLKSEPTGALSLGAVLQSPDLFKGKKVGLVVSGGNVDAGVYSRIIS